MALWGRCLLNGRGFNCVGYSPTEPKEIKMDKRYYNLLSYFQYWSKCDPMDINNREHSLKVLTGKNCWDWINYLFLEAVARESGRRIPYRERN